MLRALEYPGMNDLTATTAAAPGVGLAARPHDLAKIVSWIEDRKVGSVKRGGYD